MIDLTPSVKTEFTQETDIAIEQDTGVLIVRVVERSPCDRAGLRAGDIIQKINGRPIKKASEVQKQVESSTVSTVLKMEVNRQGSIQTFNVKPESFPVDVG